MEEDERFTAGANDSKSNHVPPTTAPEHMPLPATVPTDVASTSSASRLRSASVEACNCQASMRFCSSAAETSVLVMMMLVMMMLVIF